MSLRPNNQSPALSQNSTDVNRLAKVLAIGMNLSSLESDEVDTDAGARAQMKRPAKASQQERAAERAADRLAAQARERQRAAEQARERLAAQAREMRRAAEQDRERLAAQVREMRRAAEQARERERATAKLRLMSPEGGWSFKVLRMKDEHVEAFDGHEAESFLETFARYRFYAVAEDDNEYRGHDAVLPRVDDRFLTNVRYSTHLHTVLTEDDELNDRLIKLSLIHISEPTRPY